MPRTLDRNPKAFHHALAWEDTLVSFACGSVPKALSLRAGVRCAGVSKYMFQLI